MREPPPAAGLVTPSGGTLRAVPGPRGAVSGTVDLAAIAAAADQRLGAAARAQKQPGRRSLVHARTGRRHVDERRDCRDIGPACVPSTVWGTASMRNRQVGLGAVLALDTSAFLARQPPPRQPETTRHDGITPSNTPPSIRHPTHRLLWDAPENRASGPPSTLCNANHSPALLRGRPLRKPVVKIQLNATGMCNAAGVRASAPRTKTRPHRWRRFKRPVRGAYLPSGLPAGRWDRPELHRMLDQVRSRRRGGGLETRQAVALAARPSTAHGSAGSSEGGLQVAYRGHRHHLSSRLRRSHKFEIDFPCGSRRNSSVARVGGGGDACFRRILADSVTPVYAA